MWQTKVFMCSRKTAAQAATLEYKALAWQRAKDRMDKWLKQRAGKIQYQEVFISNGYAVEWRPLRRIG